MVTEKAARCECAEVGRVAAGMECWYSPEELAVANHEPGECRGTLDLALYEDKATGQRLHLCSVCNLTRHRRIERE